MIAVMFNILMRHIANGHQLLIWHRRQFESSGLLVELELLR